MGEALRVLIIEDSMEDTFFIVRELQRSGYQVDFERVETQAAMERALRRGAWDLIISDYQMPSFDGMCALEVFQAFGIQAPFIIVSGVLGEARATEMLEAGANDYVTKDNLGRLGPAVQRELGKTGRRDGQSVSASSERRNPGV